MADGDMSLIDTARAEAYATPLETSTSASPSGSATNTLWPFFERLRREDPVHYTAESEFGPYWSMTNYNDIMDVDTNHGVFSSESGITDHRRRRTSTALPMFIAMDPPKHDAQRKVVSPIVSPGNLPNWSR